MWRRLSSAVLSALCGLPLTVAAQTAPGEQYLKSVPGMEEYRIRKVETDGIGMTHTWADQYHRGIPVFGGEAIVHLRADGSLSSVSEEALTQIEAPTEVRVSASEAVAVAEGLAAMAYGGLPVDRSVPKLYVARIEERDRLAYQVQVGTIETEKDTALPIVWVDALTGGVLWVYDNLHRQVAQGPTLYMGQRFFPVTFFNGRYYMEDRNRKMQLFTGNDTNSNEYRVSDIDLLFDSPGHTGPNDAWLGMLFTYEYFSQRHGFQGMNGQKGPVSELMTNAVQGFTCVSDYGRPFSRGSTNAHWNGLRKKAYFGGAAGIIGTGEFVSTDVVGHELTHAVIQATAGIIYSGQSGAVNESLADVFGAMVERFRDGSTNFSTYLIGENVVDPSNTGGAFRDMVDPERKSQPDHLSEFDFGVGDAGNVHVNSGIPNRAYTLVALGGEHSNSPGEPMSGIGEAKAERIWFRALRYHMGTFTRFSRARRNTIEAARELYGSFSNEVSTVRRAWEKCGVE